MLLSSDEFFTRFGDLVRETEDGNWVEINANDPAEIQRRLDACDLWTMIDTQESTIYLRNGLHYVNRMGLHRSTQAYTPAEADRIDVLWFADDEIDAGQ